MKIQELTLFTARLSEQISFYRDVLALEITDQQTDSVCFKIGNSLLRFQQRPDATPYHFAINIPANQEKEALIWLKQRLNVLKSGESEIQEFASWNAKAVYFYDADRNIVEFIARQNLQNTSEQPFTANSLQSICEIGVPSDNIERQFSFLQDSLGLNIYDGNLERFCAVGEESGLFICIDNTVKDWFPTSDPGYPSPFGAKVAVAEKVHAVRFDGNALSLSTQQPA